MASPQKPKFDPNAALRDFNAYFGGLRKDYGEDAIRAAGFSPRDLAAMQASLRKLQMDPRATPEQHQQAYQQARDALAQRVTTPLTAARKPVEITVRPEVMPTPPPPPPPRPEITVRPEVMPTPVTPPLPADYPADLRAPGGGIPSVIFTGEGYKPNPAYTADVAMQRYRAELPNNNYYSPQERQQIMSSIENAYAQPGATGQQISDAYQNASVAATRARPQVGPAAPVPSATDYIASIVTPPKPAELPMPPVGSPALLGNAPRPVDPSMVQPTAPGILPGITQMQPAAPSMNTQPGADFDRNVARRIFDSEFRTLREKYGDQGLRAAGFTPRTLSALQAPLTNVQKDNTISYDQSSAALENALQQLRGYNFGGAQPAAPMQPAAPAPLPAGAQQSPIPGYYRGGPVMRYR